MCFLSDSLEFMVALSPVSTAMAFLEKGDRTQGVGGEEVGTIRALDAPNHVHGQDVCLIGVSH